MKLCWANSLRGALLLMVILGGRHACGQEPEEGGSPGTAIVRSIRIVRDDGKTLGENPPSLAV